MEVFGVFSLYGLSCPGGLICVYVELINRHGGGEELDLLCVPLFRSTMTSLVR